MAQHAIHLSRGRAALLTIAVSNMLDDVRCRRRDLAVSDPERAECHAVELALRDLLQFLPSV